MKDEISTRPYTPDLDYFYRVVMHRERRGFIMLVALALFATVPCLLIAPTKTWQFWVPGLLIAALVLPAGRMYCRYCAQRVLRLNPLVPNSVSRLHFTRQGIRFEHQIEAQSATQDQSGEYSWDYFRGVEWAGDNYFFLLPKQGEKWGWLVNPAWFESVDDWNAVHQILREYFGAAPAR